MRSAILKIDHAVLSHVGINRLLGAAAFVAGLALLVLQGGS